MHTSTGFLLSACLLLLACGENHSSEQQDTIHKFQNKNDAFDTAMIAVVSMNEDSSWLFKNAKPMSLTKNDLQVVDSLLKECIQTNNGNLDTANKLSEYIDLKKYRRQYVPYIDAKGTKRVYVNCFCILNSNFKNWKKILIQKGNGGSCFFQVNINLTTLEYDQFPTNGYG